MLAVEASSVLTHLLIGAALIVAIFLIGLVLIPWARRRWHPAARREDGTRAEGFSLERLEQMRAAGEISDQEFRTLRRLALGLDAKAAKTGDCASSAPARADDDDSGAGTEGPRADRDVEKE